MCTDEFVIVHTQYGDVLWDFEPRMVGGMYRICSAAVPCCKDGDRTRQRIDETGKLGGVRFRRGEYAVLPGPVQCGGKGLASMTAPFPFLSVGSENV